MKNWPEARSAEYLQVIFFTRTLAWFMVLEKNNKSRQMVIVRTVVVWDSGGSLFIF